MSLNNILDINGEILHLLGGDAYLNNPPTAGSGTCNTSETLLAPVNPDRTSIFIANTGSYDIWLGYQTGIQVGEGIPIRIDGGWIRTAWKGAIYGITETGSSTFSTMEVEGEG